MKKQIFLSLIILTLLINCGGFSGGGRGSKTVTSEIGLIIPSMGVAVDAVYDKRLDNLVPGYKILNVVVTNQSKGMVELDVRGDRWKLRDSMGKLHTGLNHLSYASKQAWSKLPDRVKEKFAYPNVVRNGETAKIDLFFPASVDLYNFREINWSSVHFKKLFALKSTVSRTLDWQKPEPKPERTASYEQSLRKYDGEAKRVDSPVEPDEDPSVATTEKKRNSSKTFDPRLDDWSIPLD